MHQACCHSSCLLHGSATQYLRPCGTSSSSGNCSKITASSETSFHAGTLRSCDPDRVVLKKILLSGYPVKVHKKKAVVRWMFHNPEDVRWFKPLELWTKYGRRGRIKVSCRLLPILCWHSSTCCTCLRLQYILARVHIDSKHSFVLCVRTLAGLCFVYTRA